MTIYEVATFLLVGAFLGMVGQMARVIVGLKKLKDKTPSENFWEEFNSKQLIISILIGGVAGTLAAITLLEEEVGKQTLLTLIVVGYAGADFIEGFIQRQSPK